MEKSLKDVGPYATCARFMIKSGKVDWGLARGPEYQEYRRKYGVPLSSLEKRCRQRNQGIIISINKNEK